MVPFIAFLMYTWALLPILVACKEPPPCVFPFLFNGRYYSSCTQDGTPDQQLWCATSENYDKDHKWKPCAISEYGGNADAKPCVFPFIYMGHTYYTCTNKFAHKGRYWCATTGSYDKDKKWSYCADTRLDASYPTGACSFPFIFEGKAYSACTTDGRPDGKLWCSLSSNYDANPMWTYCEPSDPAPCIFPFIFRNKSYSSCIKEGSSDGQLWCATSPNYDRDSRWKACSLQEHGGNSNGQPCFFPFTYKNQTFNDCTNEDEENVRNGRFWCSTTENYDVDHKWSFCADTNLRSGEVILAGQDGDQCVFPFTYKGKTYTGCTSAGTINWKYWCSLTKNYDADRKWKNCEPSDLKKQDEPQP
ncbi:epididymal sperm-binding protein 1-like [Rhineura floridana]|uniref:epididymal sperm-binding protein 1-like n=1 Tax=Rhineura floridana TaxID=261503 RepID=UPI002AC84987|nr:epididymal sperm-binding protein 1-like [Rhineura floridana]